MTLEAGDALGTQQFGLLRALDGFGYRDQAAALGKAEQMAKQNAVVRFARSLSDKRTVDLDDLDG